MDLEREWEEILKELIINNSFIEAEDDDFCLISDPIDSVQTFEEATLLTYDRGVVVKLIDGRQLQITILEC